MTFRDRRDAGLRLAEILQQEGDTENLLILALPRGGVPVADEIAKALHAPLDVLVVRKIGMPGNPELALGAVASGDIVVLNEDVITEFGLSRTQIEPLVDATQEEVRARELLFRGAKPYPTLLGKRIILVDDGLATGATMRAAISAVKGKKPASVVVAVPVGSREACEAIRNSVDRLICIESPPVFYAVGAWYENFLPTEDKEVQELLQQY